MKSAQEFATVYLHRDVVDFRKSINGLSVIVEQEMELSPYTDAVFVFCNKQRDKLKVLYWDKTGFCLWYKRLEKDKFKWPRKHQQADIELSTQQLQWLLQGLDLNQMQPHKHLYFNELA
ncbi:MAG: IS66 family insertion sequence element accessory protein TnpB [Sinobacterium sp.]|nr:IS66 family insertion sequence element accessory protein TnpB [Sinobacterium sp.]